jgi:hypothetical protein
MNLNLFEGHASFSFEIRHPILTAKQTDFILLCLPRRLSQHLLSFLKKVARAEE